MRRGSVGQRVEVADAAVAPASGGAAEPLSEAFQFLCRHRLVPSTWAGRTRGWPGPRRGARIVSITVVNCVQSLMFPPVTVEASGRPKASQAR